VLARSLDPEFDIWEASRPVIESWMIDHLGPEQRLKEAAEGLTNFGRLAQNIPQLLRDTEYISAQLAEVDCACIPRHCARSRRCRRRARVRSVSQWPSQRQPRSGGLRWDCSRSVFRRSARRASRANQ
jgi:predicted unusual protein kinase regulating ubiquinone biosynthesis (AarF/ABC1/UbiB family)